MHTKAYRGRHRLGTPGLVHCVLHPEVTATLAANRRGQPTALLLSARTSISRFRRALRGALGARAHAPSV
jgi:hypothetical protein